MGTGLPKDIFGIGRDDLRFIPLVDQILDGVEEVKDITGTGDQGRIEYDSDIAQESSVQDFLDSEKVNYLTQLYNNRARQRMEDAAIPMLNRFSTVDRAKEFSDLLFFKRNYPEVETDTPEGRDIYQEWTKKVNTATDDEYDPRDPNLRPTYERAEDGEAIFRGFEFRNPIVNQQQLLEELDTSLIAPEERKRAQATQINVNQTIKDLSEGNVEEISEWREVAQILTNYHGMFSMYEAAQQMVETGDSQNVESALRSMFTRKGVPVDNEWLDGLLAIEDPKGFKRSIEILMWNYQEPLEPHVRALTGGSLATNGITYFKGPTKGEKIVGAAGEAIQGLYDVPLLGDFLEWIDKPSQSLFYLLGGFSQAFGKAITGDFDEAYGVFIEGMKGSANEALQFTGIPSPFGGDERTSSFDLDQNNYIDIFEVFGEQNTIGVWGDIINIIAAAGTDPLGGFGIGGRLGRNTIKSITQQGLKDDSALVAVANALGEAPVVTSKRLFSAVTKLKDKGWRALDSQEKKILEQVVRQHLEIVYSNFPKTGRFRNATRNVRNLNGAKLTKVENDLRIIMRQLEKGGRDGIRYYGKTIVPADRFRKASEFANVVIHADGTQTVVPSELMISPTILDEAANFGDDMLEGLDKTADAKANLEDPFGDPIVSKGIDAQNQMREWINLYYPVEIFASSRGVPWAAGTPNPTKAQMTWYNSMIGAEWKAYSYPPLKKGEKITEPIEGPLFTLLDEPDLKGVVRPQVGPVDPTTVSSASAALDEAFELKAGQTQLPVQQTADDLLRYLSDETIFPATPEGQLAKRAYVEQLADVLSAPIINAMIYRAPSLFTNVFLKFNLINQLRKSFSPRWEVEVVAGKEIADATRTPFVMADQKAALAYKNWVNRVFRMEEFGKPSLALRAKQAWESLDDQVVKGTTVPRSFEIGSDSLIGQFTSGRANRDSLLIEFEAGTDVGDWLRAFDELRDEIWGYIPNNIKEKYKLDKYNYTPRVSANIRKGMETDDVANFLRRNVKNWTGLDLGVRTVMDKWVKGLEKEFGKEFVRQGYFVDLLENISKQFNKDAQRQGATSVMGDLFLKRRGIAPEIQDLAMVNDEFRKYVESTFNKLYMDMGGNAGQAWSSVDLTSDGQVILGEAAKRASNIEDMFTINYLDAWTVRSKAAFNAHVLTDYLHGLTKVVDSAGAPMARVATLTPEQITQARKTGKLGYVDDSGQFTLGGGRVSPFGMSQPSFVPLTNAKGQLVTDMMNDGTVVFIRKEIAEDAQTLFSILTDRQAQTQFENILRVQSDRWARYALLSPAFLTRNAQSNMLLAYLGGLRNPAHLIRSMKLQSSRAQAQRIQKASGRSLDEIYDEMIAAGDLSRADISFIKELDTYGIYNTQADDIFSTAAISKYNVTQISRSLNSAIENNSRGALFLSSRAQGMSADAASVNVRKYLFDYKDLTIKEQAFRDKFSRFYTFFRKNTAVQLGAMATMPARVANAARIEKAFTDNMVEWFTGEEHDPDNRTPLPYWASLGGMRRYGGSLIGMDAPLTSAFQTMSAVFAIPALLYKGYTFTDDLTTDILGGEPKRGEVDEFFGKVFGSDRSVSELLLQFSGLAAGFAPNMIVSVMNLVNQQNSFTKKRIESPKDVALTFSSMFNPAIDRIVKFYEKLTSDKNKGHALANILGGLKVFTDEQVDDNMRYGAKRVLEDIKEGMPMDSRPDTGDLVALGLRQVQDTIITSFIYDRFVDGEELPVKEFEKNFLESIGLGEKADLSKFPFSDIPNDIDTSTSGGREKYQFYLAQATQEIINLWDAWHMLSQESKEMSVVFPKLENQLLINPDILFKLVLAVQPTETQEELGITVNIGEENPFAATDDEPVATGSRASIILEGVDRALPSRFGDDIGGELQKMYPLKTYEQQMIEFAALAVANGDTSEADKIKWVVENVSGNMNAIFYNAFVSTDTPTGEMLYFIKSLEDEWLDPHVQGMSNEEFIEKAHIASQGMIATAMLVYFNLTGETMPNDLAKILTDVYAAESIGLEAARNRGLISRETYEAALKPREFNQTERQTVEERREDEKQKIDLFNVLTEGSYGMYDIESDPSEQERRLNNRFNPSPLPENLPESSRFFTP
jgi:hypothetical protein